MTTAGATLTLPSSEQVTSDGTVTVTPAGYSDSFAQSNPGSMFLNITDSSGDLQAYYPASGNSAVAAGNNTNAITFQGSYADVNAILNSLTYAATVAGGTDAIHYDVWNQAGVETTGDVPVTIGGGGGGGGNTETWTGQFSNSWYNVGNWSGGAVPGSGDTAIIPNQGNIPFLSQATLTNETITLAMPAEPNAGPTIDLNGVTLGGGSVLDVSNPSGSQNGATAVISGNFTVDAGATVTEPPNSILDLTLTDAGATLVNNGTVENTYFNFTAGGTLANNGVIIDDNGASEATSTNVDVLNSGTIVAANNGFFGLGENSTISGGTVLIANGRVQLDGTIAGTDVVFNGAGHLLLEQTNVFAAGAVVSGFGAGDGIGLSGNAAIQGSTLSFNNGTLDIALNGTVSEAIPFNGSYGLGNFEEHAGFGIIGGVVYAPDGGFSGAETPDIAAPAAATVAQGSTLSLGGVAIHNSTTSTTVSITAGSGTLYMNGATGSGTNHVTLAASTDQVNADLASLTYVPAAGTIGDTVRVEADLTVPNAQEETYRWIPITVSASGGGGPALREPGSETVPASGRVAVSGSYSDSFAQGNPGSLFLGITDSGGTLSATNASGQAVAGSGSNSITLNTDYADVNAVLQSLTYTAGASAGSDSIHFDIWNQAGVETTDNVPVTITGGGGGGGGPALTEPSSETVAPSGTVTVSGSYADSFAQGNPGSLFLGITDSSGMLSATDAAGNAVAGSGTNSIALSTDYVDVNAILANLHYAAGASAGTDTIHFDVWNQAGVETTAATAMTIGASSFSTAASQASPGMALDFIGPGAGAPSVLAPTGSSAGGTMLGDLGTQPIGMPLLPHS